MSPRPIDGWSRWWRTPTSWRARAIGLTLGSPRVSQFGIVEGLLVDRAFVEDRARHAAALAHISDLAGRGPHPFTAVVSDAACGCPRLRC